MVNFEGHNTLPIHDVYRIMNKYNDKVYIENDTCICFENKMQKSAGSNACF